MADMVDMAALGSFSATVPPLCYSSEFRGSVATLD